MIFVLGKLFEEPLRTFYFRPCPLDRARIVQVNSTLCPVKETGEGKFIEFKLKKLILKDKQFEIISKFRNRFQI